MGTCKWYEYISLSTQSCFKFIFTTDHPSQSISLPDTRAKTGTSKVRNQGEKASKEKQLGKEINSAVKVICGKGVKLEGN